MSYIEQVHEVTFSAHFTQTQLCLKLALLIDSDWHFAHTAGLF